MSKGKRTLVIVPCAQQKAWDKNPKLGSVSAKEAYTSIPFRLNRQFAEKFGDQWLILSAKYGFIWPEFRIPGNYNVTFKKKDTSPISQSRLKDQVTKKKLYNCTKIFALGGKEYRQAIQEAFADYPITIIYPFAGLPIGKTVLST